MKPTVRRLLAGLLAASAYGHGVSPAPAATAGALNTLIARSIERFKDDGASYRRLVELTVLRLTSDDVTRRFTEQDRREVLDNAQKLGNAEASDLVKTWLVAGVLEVSSADTGVETLLARAGALAQKLHAIRDSGVRSNYENYADGQAVHQIAHGHLMELDSILAELRERTGSPSIDVRVAANEGIRVHGAVQSFFWSWYVSWAAP